MNRSNGTGNHPLSRSLHPSSDARDAAELRRRFAAAVRAPTADALRSLFVAAEAIAVSMRTKALPPERALVLLKAMLRAENQGQWSPSLVGGAHERQPRLESSLYEALFARWLAAYFADSS